MLLNPHVFLSFQVMRRLPKSFSVYVAVFAILSGFVSNLQSQITIDNTREVKDIVQNELLGAGISMKNMRFEGDETQFGVFINDNSNLRIDQGIIMATGDAMIASTEHPDASLNSTNQNAGSTSSLFNNWGDDDLEKIAGQKTFDAAVLEFDFIPLSDTLKFNYVFASEEYPEYNCTEFNDVFAFLLSGPGYPQPVNLAIIPGSDDMPVAINSVNNGFLGSVGGNISFCTPPKGSIDNTDLYVSNDFGEPFIEFDGLTTKLQAKAVVIPCTTYHIKLAIADASDNRFDSAVFLESNSFGTSGLKIAVATLNNDNIAYEGCTEAEVSFSYPRALDVDVIFDYRILGDAQPGIDYPDIPTRIVLPAGRRDTSFVISPYQDFISEGEETVLIELTLPFCLQKDTIEIEIRDEGLLSVSPEEIQINLGTPVTIPYTANFAGIGSGTFSWSPESGLSDPNSNTPTATVSDSVTYTVTYEDGECIQTAVAKILPVPNLEPFVPNVVTPNGDGINDEITPYFRYPENVVYDFQVYDRFGSLVFDAKDIPTTDPVIWDATFNGKVLGPGVYIYHMFARSPSEQRIFTGDITLIR